MFASSLIISFSLTVKTYNAPADGTFDKIFDKFAHTHQLFAIIHTN
jgi:hypothetical protein